MSALDTSRRARTRMLATLASLAVSAQVLAIQQPSAAPNATPATQANAQADAPILQPLRVVVSIPPLRGLIEPLLPAGSTVEVLIPPGVSEHGYEIPPARLAALANADLVVTVGLGLEPQVDKFLTANPRSASATPRRHVQFARAMNLGVEGAATHTHNHADGESCAACNHGQGDPHLWLDPQAAKVLVAEASRQLIALRPLDVPLKDHPIRIATRTLQDRLDALDTQYRTAVDALPADRRTIVVAHDAYSWLAKRYGLETVAIKGLTAQEPAPADLARAIATVRDRKISTVFIEPQISSKASHRVAEATGARVAMLDPLGNGDYFRMMTDNLAAIRAALTPESK